MEIASINLVYFSATYTTRKIARLIAREFTGEKKEYDITPASPDHPVILGKDDLLIAGMPVYAGRIPISAFHALNQFKGKNTPAIIICVYGNRDYDDALLELKEIVESNGFLVISAGAFIAQHSIFPEAGANRPDEKDTLLIKEFANTSSKILLNLKDTSLPEAISVKGNNPYKIPGKIPFQPKGSKKCNECGSCVKLCPVEAIPKDNPRKTDKEKCISCGRCIVVCPQNARNFRGLLYKVVAKKFINTYSTRKEPETMFSKL